MTNRMTRLIYEDSDFARLVAASHGEEPSIQQVERALALAAEVAAAPRVASWRWLGPSLAVGVVVIGASVAGLIGARGGHPRLEAVVGGEGDPARSNDIQRAYASATVDLAPTSGASPDETSLEATLSVDDLPAAPPEKTKGQRSPGQVAVPIRDAPSFAKATARADSNVAIAPSGQSSFSAEVALLSMARSALEAGDIQSCMGAIAHYDERFPSGVFSQEIETVRVEALVASGEQARAGVFAERFLAAHPESPYSGLVRSLVERFRK